MFDSNNPHNDPKLAMKCYPSGNKRIATSKCICGSVEIRVETDDPVMTAFCHCWNCRSMSNTLIRRLIEMLARICDE